MVLFWSFFYTKVLFFFFVLLKWSFFLFCPAEMVPFWSFFFTQKSFFVQYRPFLCPFCVLFCVISSFFCVISSFCREMCNIVNTRFLRPFGVIMEITTKSPQKLYNGSFFGTFFYSKVLFFPIEKFLTSSP